MRYMKYSDLDAYKSSREINRIIYPLVSKWSYFDQDTLGRQLVRSADSIGANLSEGFGRYHKKDKIRFYHFSLGSCNETEHWISLAAERSLITDNAIAIIQEQLNALPKQINHLIAFTRSKLKK
jgi:four helix bundle protein